MPLYEGHAILECQSGNDPSSMVVLYLKHLYDNVYARSWEAKTTGRIDQKAWAQWKKATIYITTNPDSDRHESWDCSILIRGLPEGFDIEKPSNYSHEASRRFPVYLLGCGEKTTYRRSITSKDGECILLSIDVRKVNDY